jgi:sugar transferase (PEP-CTERM/EpsH1 system associated)
MSWVYRREADRLLKEERRGAQQARLSLFASAREAALFRSLAPESAVRVKVLGNGVDTAYFEPSSGCPTPYASEEWPIVFVGTMDYPPNVDAVCWFVQKILPPLRQRWPHVHFHIVGRNPTAAVRALAGPGVSVTGSVPDVRPWLQHAAAVVAPLRLVRGVINKVLEAMAMSRPVVSTLACAESVQAVHGQHLLAAADEADFTAQVERLLANRPAAEALGRAARDFVCTAYNWNERMARLDDYLAQAAGVHT